MLPQQFYIRRNLINNAKDNLPYFPVKPAAYGAKTYPYTLMTGENLFTVAERLFGKNSDMWGLLSELNTIKRLDEWQAGDTVILPELVIIDSPQTFRESILRDKKVIFEKPRQIFTPVSITTCAVPTVTIDTITGTSFIVHLASATGNVLYWLYQYRVVGAPDWSVLTASFTAAVTISGLTPDTEYEVRANTFCSHGASSAYSAPVAAETLAAEVCAVPTLLVFDAQNTSFKVLISADDALTVNYALEYKKLVDLVWTVLYLPAGTHTISGLENTTEYEVRLKRICNGIPASGYTATTNVTTTGLCETIDGLAVSDSTMTSLSFIWFAGLNNNRWHCTLQQGSVGYFKITSTPTVTFENLTPGTSYTLVVVPDCAICIPSEPDIIVDGGGAAVKNNSFNTVFIKSYNELSLRTTPLTGVSGKSLNAVYEQKILNKTPVKTDFSYMVASDLKALALRSTALDMRTIITIDLFTAYNGIGSNRSEIKPGINNKLILDLATNDIWTSIDGAAIDAPANIIKIGGDTCGTIDITACAEATALLEAGGYTPAYCINVKFLDLDLAIVQPSHNLPIYSDAEIIAWCSEFAEKVVTVITDYNLAGKDIIIPGVPAFLLRSTAVREAYHACLKTIKLSLTFPATLGFLMSSRFYHIQRDIANKYVFPIDDIIAEVANSLFIDWEEPVTLVPTTSESEFDTLLFSFAENWHMQMLHSNTAPVPDAIAVAKSKLSSSDLLFKSNSTFTTISPMVGRKHVVGWQEGDHFLPSPTPTVPLPSSMKYNGVVVAMGSSKAMSSFAGSATIEATAPYGQVFGATTLHATDFVNYFWLQTNAADKKYSATTFPNMPLAISNFEFEVEFRIGAASSGANPVIWHLSNDLYLYIDGTDIKLYDAFFAAAPTTTTVGSFVVNTLIKTKLLIYFDAGTYKLEMFKDGLTVFNYALAATRTIPNGTTIGFGGLPDLSRLQELKVYKVFIGADTMGTVYGGLFLFCDKVFGLRTSYTYARDENRPIHIGVGYASAAGAMVEPNAPPVNKYQATAYPTLIGSSHSLYSYYNRVASLNYYLVDIYGLYGSTFEISEAEQQFSLARASAKIEDLNLGTYIYVKHLDSRYYKALSAVDGSELFFKDAPEHLLNTALNGKQFLGYSGAIKDKITPP